MTVEFCGLTLAHPIVNGSGTFDALAAQRAFGDGLLAGFPFSAYVSKTITLQPRDGNPPPRLWETPAGLINSIGLPNKGLDGYLREDLPQLAELLAAVGAKTIASAGPNAPVRPPVPADAGGPPQAAWGTGGRPPIPLITNVMGASAEEFTRLVDACEAQAPIAAIELNVSCPNVQTGLDIGADPHQLEQVVRAVRARTGKPLIVKLTPNTADVSACARAAEEGGADALSLINTLRAMALAPRGQPGAHRDRWLGGGSGGLSGPAVRAVALAQVAAVAERVAIPIIGMGGVQSSAHARDLLDAGATLVAVGTESFRDPATGARIALELG